MRLTVCFYLSLVYFFFLISYCNKQGSIINKGIKFILILPLVLKFLLPVVSVAVLLIPNWIVTVLVVLAITITAFEGNIPDEKQTKKISRK